MQFSEEQIKQLYEGYDKAHFAYLDRINKYPKIDCNDEAKEYLLHGYFRRLITLKKCIKNIYEIYPPARKELLTEDERDNIIINLQAFLINLYGCIDNLCWVLVKEKNIEISPARVNFYDKKIQKILSDDFKNYLKDEKFKNWYDYYCKEFRHSLAHRIPLHVPEAVNQLKQERYNEIPNEKLKAIIDRDYEKAEELEQEQKSLMLNYPMFVHSLSEGSEHVIFHSQIIADFNTIIELADNFFEYFQAMDKDTGVVKTQADI